MLQFVVPLAMPRAPVWSFDHMTRVTAPPAVPPTMIEDDDVAKVSPEVGEVIAMVGGPVVLPPVEPPPVPKYVTVTVSTPELPALSNAVTVMTFVPFCSGMPDTLQFDVPAAVPLKPRSLVHLTCVTPTLSLAVPPRFIDEPLAVYDELLVGDVMVATGRVVSPPPPPPVALIVHVNCCVAVSVPSFARAVTLYVPAVVPVPDM